MYVHEHPPCGFPYKHCWRDASLVRLNYLSVNLKSTSLHFGIWLKHHFRPGESELAKGRKEEDCFLHSSAVGLKRCLLLQSLLFLLLLLAPDSKPPPCWPCAQRDGRLHRIENSSRDFPLSDKGSVFLVEKESDRQSGRKGDSAWARSGNLLPTRAPLLHALPYITIASSSTCVCALTPYVVCLIGSTAILIVSVWLNASR